MAGGHGAWKRRKRVAIVAYYKDYNSSESKLVSVRLRLDLFERIDKLADETGRSRSSLVNSLLAKALDGEKNDRVELLERDVRRLSEDLTALRMEFASLRSEHSIGIDIDDL